MKRLKNTLTEKEYQEGRAKAIAALERGEDVQYINDIHIFEFLSTDSDGCLTI